MGTVLRPHIATFKSRFNVETYGVGVKANARWHQHLVVPDVTTFLSGWVLLHNKSFLLLQGAGSLQLLSAELMFSKGSAIYCPANKWRKLAAVCDHMTTTVVSRL